MRSADSYQAATMFLLVLPYQVSAAVVLSTGRQFRAAWYRCKTMVVAVLVCLAFICTLQLAPPSPLSCLFRVNCTNRVASSMYIPVLSEISVMSFPGCFFGPQGAHWYQGGAEGGYLPEMSSTPTRCFPPADFSFNFPTSPDPAGVNLAQEGPHNVFPFAWNL